jgi:hypothetical protein
MNGGDSGKSGKHLRSYQKKGGFRMISGTINNSLLRQLLEFESLKHAISIEYSETSSPLTGGYPFRPVIQITGYSGRQKQTLELPFEDEILSLEINFHAFDDCKDYIGMGTGEQEIKIAGVNKNQMFLFFSLEKLFDNAAHIERKPANTETSQGNPASKILDAIFSKAMPVLMLNIKEYDWAEERKTYAEAKLCALEESVKTWERDIESNQDEINEKTWEIQKLVQKNEQLIRAIDTIKKDTKSLQKRKADEEHDALVKMLQSGAIKEFDVAGNKLTFKTGQIEIEFEDYTYTLGPFQVEIPFAGDRIHIKGQDKQYIVDDYCHPHVSSDGSPCLGNAGPIIAKLLGTGDMTGAVNCILEFLRSYTAGNAYIKLQKWNPDWEDDEGRYESCYDTSSSHDCVLCDDYDCPFKEDAQERCFEYAETIHCINCGDCDMRESAIENCRRDHQSWQCVQCEHSCTYAGEEDECANSHDGEKCPDCPVTSCSHWKEHNKDEEEKSCETEEQPQAAEGGAT